MCRRLPLRCIAGVTRCVRCVRVVVVFSTNKLTSLPDSIADLTQLTTLKLKYVSPSSSPLYLLFILFCPAMLSYVR